MNNPTKKMIYLALLAAVAIVLGYFESLFPLPTPVPYIKLGLGNVIIVTVLYVFDAKAALFVSLTKVLISSILFLGFSGFLYSFTGAAASWMIMTLLKKTGLFSQLGVSIAGGVFHMLGQIGVAVLLIENISLSFFLSPLLLAGAGTGVCVGFIAAQLTAQLKKIMAQSNVLH